MLLNETKRQKSQKLFTTLYLIIYSLLLIITFLDTTMFSIKWPNQTMIILLELATTFIIIKVLLIDKLSRNEIIFFIFLSISFLGTCIYTEYGFLVFNLILILGAKNVPFKKILWLYCAIAGSILIITMISSQMGLVENLVYIRNGKSRISFGFNYPTDFTAHIFYLILGYCYLRKETLTNPELTSILGLSVFSYIFCDARTNVFCMVLTFAVFLYLKLRNHISDKADCHYVMNPKFSRVLVFSMPICAIFFISLTFLFNDQTNNIILNIINSLVSNRLYLGNIGLERYGIHLFGSTFQMFGYGGSTTPPSDYFFLDSSYVLILIRYGILIFLAVLIIFVFSSLRAEKQKNIALLWILTLIAIQCMTEHHLLDIAYNPFLFLIFSETVSEDYNNFSILMKN